MFLKSVTILIILTEINTIPGGLRKFWDLRQVCCRSLENVGGLTHILLPVQVTNSLVCSHNKLISSKMQVLHRNIHNSGLSPLCFPQGVLCRTLQGHAHWVNTLALNTDYVLRTGAYNPAKASIVYEEDTSSSEFWLPCPPKASRWTSCITVALVCSLLHCASWPS